MRLRAFVSLLGIVALVAIIYSPSTIGITAGGGYGSTSPADTSQSGTSQFLSFLRESGYRVVLVNNTQQESAALSNGVGGLSYFLIGPDLPLSSSEAQAVTRQYQSGRFSLLIAEGNATNRVFLSGLFGAEVTGAAITDPTSPFKDQRVFPVELSLGGTRTSGIIDIASPIVLHSRALRAVATSSPLSYDAANSTLGRRVVVAAGASGTGGHALLVTDSGPFTNYLFNYTQGVDEKAFVQQLVSWAVPSKGGTVVLDNYHYSAPKAPAFQAGIPIGPLVAFALQQDLSNLDSYYNSFPSQVQGFFQGFGIIFPEVLARLAMTAFVLLIVYWAVNRWFAAEKKGSDNQPLPGVERSIVAESKARTDFLKTSRSKSFYVATLSRLYEVLDDIAVREFSANLSKVSTRDLSPKLGEKGSEEAVRLFSELSRVYEYATGKRRFLFPPVLRWKAYTSSLTGRAESFLNMVGMTAKEETSKAQIEYAMRRRRSPNAREEL